MSARVLVIDDEPDWRATYGEWLVDDGYDVITAANRAEAEAAAIQRRPHVVVLDQKLEGGGGRDSGLGLLPWLRDNVPATRTIIVTAYASREAVERAYREGAFDYLEKRDVLEPLLRIKVRAAAELARASLDDADRERGLRDAWSGARTEQDPQEKGALLERTVQLLFSSIPGMHWARTNAANANEEMDVLVTNQSTNPLLQRQGDFIVVECKNQRGPAGVPVLNKLESRLRRRYGRSRLGVCVAPGGFADTVPAELLALRTDDLLILTVDAAELDQWIGSRDREEWLVRRIERAVVGR